jgi:hypothetical protein
MALKPGEAFHGKEFEAQVADAEKWIDESLKSQGRARGEGPITIQRDMRWNPAVVKELIERYSAAGWKVEHVSDPRDGDYLQFTALTRLAQAEMQR